MISAPLTALLLHLKGGIVDPADIAMLEKMPASRLVDEIRSEYTLPFQERLIGKKWELSLARSFRAELVFRGMADDIFMSALLLPAYVNCVMLNIEDDLVTGISRINRLTAWAVAKPERGLALRVGRGFKLDKAPDGWAIKPMRTRVVRLSEEFLRARGWRFDHLKQFVPHP
jgi:hypothetical protein